MKETSHYLSSSIYNRKEKYKMEDLYRQIADYEKKQIRKTNILSGVLLIIGITGIITSIFCHYKITGIISVFIILLAVTDLLMSNLSTKATIKKIYKNKPSLREGTIADIKDNILTVTDKYGMEYTVTSVTKHKFNIEDKIFFIGINRVLGMKCEQVRYVFYNGMIL